MPPAPTSQARCRIAMPGGIRSAAVGKNARELLTQSQKAYLLFGGMEPWADALGVDAAKALRRRELRGRGHAVSPTRRSSRWRMCCCRSGTFAETSGTYVNLEGQWQSFAGAAKPLGEARPGWKVLRVLGNLPGVADFDYQSSEEVREELRALCGGIAADVVPGIARSQGQRHRMRASIDVPMYAVDAVVRRAPSLQRTREGKGAPSLTAEARAHDRVDRQSDRLSGLAGCR